MPQVSLQTPYASAMPYIITALPSWTGSDYEAQRLGSYNLYDDMYDNTPNTFNLLLRGSDDTPIYVPTAKRLINTLARYVGRGWGFTVDPQSGSAEQQTLAMKTFGDLFKRERLLSKFASGKKEWLRRGDWVWYVSADPDKPAGRRLSIKAIDPRTFFPITDEDDPDVILGARIIETILMPDGITSRIKEQTWLKPNAEGHPNNIRGAFDSTGDLDEEDDPTSISYTSLLLDTADWNIPDKRTVVKTLQATTILSGITSLPLYHIKANEETGNPYGRSVLSGLESLVAGINQSITDEDLTLALAGLGMYWTDSGAPVDQDTGDATGWQLGPQQVIEVGQGRTFARLAGVTSIEPVQNHVTYLEEQAYGSQGINDIALGSRGAVRESGIALAIRMQPLFDECDDLDIQVNSVLDQMFFDLANDWFPTYEEVDLSACVIESQTDTGDRLPFDRAERWGELATGYASGIFALDYIHKQLVENFGYDLTDADLTAALKAQATKAAQADPFAARAATEVNTLPTDVPNKASIGSEASGKTGPEAGN